MFLLSGLIISLLCIIVLLCIWHYNLIESSETKGDKQKLCKLVKIVLILNLVSVLLCLMTGIYHWIIYTNHYDRQIYKLVYGWFMIYFPLLAVVSYIWMIVKEILQIKNKNLNLKNLYLLLSLILITVAGLFLYCIGLLLTLEKF